MLLKKLLLSTLFLATFVGMMGQDLQAQGIKVGYTEAELIIGRMAEYRTVMEDLQRVAESGEAEYQKLIQDYQTKLQDYQKKQALLSDTAKQTRETELVEMQSTIQEYLQNKEAELAQQQVEMMNPLLEKVQVAIDEVAKEQGLNLVLNSRAAGNPMILYADEEMNITELVMTKLGIEITTGAASSR